MTALTVISLGWGVQSFTLASMSALGDLSPVDFVIHADTTWERQHTYEFAAKWTPWLEAHGVKVVTVQPTERLRDPGYTVKKGRTSLPLYSKDGMLRRQCTGEWKIMPIRRYIQPVRVRRPVIMWIGISNDEWHRAKDSDVRYITNRFPLLDLGMTRADCVAYLQAHDLEVPGKSSCTFCPMQKRDSWREMKRTGGHDWDQAVVIDAALRNKRPPDPLFVHPACKPLPEAVDIPEDHGLEQRSLFDLPCDNGACFL